MDTKEICAKADELQHDDKWREAYDVLKEFKDSEDAEIMWRLIRSYYRVGKFLTAGKAEKMCMAETGNATVERAVSKYPDHFEVRKVSLLNNFSKCVELRRLLGIVNGYNRQDCTCS